MVARSPELVPGVAALAVFLFWATAQGGVLATDSLSGRALPAWGAVRHALRLRGAPPVGSPACPSPRSPCSARLRSGYLSIAWADDQGAAWDGANRCLLYLTAFVIFTLPPWRPRPAAALLGLYVVGIGVIGGTVLLKAADSANPLEYFIAGRFAEPTGYHNANARSSPAPSSRRSSSPPGGGPLACAGVDAGACRRPLPARPDAAEPGVADRRATRRAGLPRTRPRPGALADHGRAAGGGCRRSPPPPSSTSSTRWTTRRARDRARQRPRRS